MRPGDEKRIGADLMGTVIQRYRPFSVSDVVNLPAVIAVAVAGKGAVQLFKRKFQRMAPDISDREGESCFVVEFSDDLLRLFHIFCLSLMKSLATVQSAELLRNL